MSSPTKKRCNRCEKLLDRENFNDSKRSKDGLAKNCRSCVNRRRREQDKKKRHKRRRQGDPASDNLADAARRAKLNQVRAHAPDDPEQLDRLLWMTVRDFHSVKKRAAHVEQARFLIEKGARAHWSMVPEAARGGRQDLIEVLIDAGAETNVFVSAATGDESRLTQQLQDDAHLAKAAYEEFTALHYCAMSALGKRDAKRRRALAACAELLLKAGADVNAEATVGALGKLRPLHFASWKGGNQGVAKLLLQNGADPSGCLLYALGYVHRQSDGNYNVAELLAASGVDVPAEAGDALGRFAARADIKAVRWLLERGVDPNRATPEGRTPLHLAAERNTAVGVIQLLVEHGARPDALTGDGQTPCDLAKQNDKPRVVEFLQGLSDPQETK